MYPSPQLIRADIHTSLPADYRKPQRSDWSDVNAAGAELDSFLEGPSFDTAGNLYVTDIPHGRIFRITADGDWSLVADYDGWPNGLKIHRDGRLLVADHRRGLVEISPETGAATVLADRHNAEGLKGPNDLFFASNGDLLFTDQGQTGLQDPTGRVLRCTDQGHYADTRIVLAGIPSPNGLLLDAAEARLIVAVTRANAIWRVPLLPDATASKAGLWIQLSAGTGPDGLALDTEGGLIVAHHGIGVWRFDPAGRPTHLVELDTPGGGCTNIAFGGTDNQHLFIVDSGTATIWRAPMPYPGQLMYSHT